MWAVSIFLTLLVQGSIEPGKPAELHAKVWFNNPPFRIHDDRDVILFFFEPNDRKSIEAARELQRFSRRVPEAVVIALTEAGRNEAQRFIERGKIRFTVGAESRSRAAYRVKELPALVRIVRRNGKPVPEDVRVDDLPSVISSDLPSIQAKIERDRAILDQVAAPADLRSYVESDAFVLWRADAVSRLFEADDTANFLRFAEDQLQRGVDSPTVRWRLEFYRRKALGEDVDGQIDAPSSQSWRLFLRESDQAQWRDALEFRSAAGNKSLDELIAWYETHAMESPEHQVIRFLTLSEIGRRKLLAEEDERAAIRDRLLYLYGGEPDFGLRAQMGLLMRYYADAFDDNFARAR